MDTELQTKKDDIEQQTSVLIVDDILSDILESQKEILSEIRNIKVEIEILNNQKW